MKYILQPLIIP